MRLPTVSICVPTFELGGRGVSMLTKLLESVEIQTYKDYEVMVSDHSLNEDILKLCRDWKLRIPIAYIENERGRGSCEANLNNAIEQADGKLIKPMLQDDFFLQPTALERLVSALKTDTDWSAGGCLHCREEDVDNLFHPHSPQWVPDRSLALGQNRIGSPSVVLYPKDVKNCYFDENLLYFMDCELYYRLGLEVGPPVCIRDFLHCIRFRHDSISDSKVTDDGKGEEYHYIIAKLDKSGKTLDEFPILFERANRLGLRQP
jgi:glycosyltransferase involved in cell wall biosynthesis